MMLTGRVKIWLRVGIAYMRTFRGVRCDILDASKTVDAIVAGKSLIRFGDGEFGIYRGKDIHYQPCSERLQADFRRIKDDFEGAGQHSPFLLAVPRKYMLCTGLELGRRRVLVSSWAESRLYFKTRFSRQVTYGDSFLFERKNKDIYSRIWRQPGDARTIVFVHNNPRYAEDFGRTYGRKVLYVACPAYDAFRQVDMIMENIGRIVAENGLGPKDVQMVISAGPAGKVIAYRLSNDGYHCIDAGHCWDDPLDS